MNSLVHVVETPKTTTIRYVDLYVTELRLHEKATFLVSLYDTARNLVDRQHVTITGEEYAQWASDDDYVLQIVLGKLGLTLDPEQPALP